MKINNIKWIVVFFTLCIVFTACNKDDSIFQEQAVDNTNENQENNESSDEGEITLYRIKGENLEKIKDFKVTGKDLQFQKDTQKHQEIWALVKKIIPLSHRNRINELVLYNGEKGESAGFVFETSKDLSTWRIGIAIDYAYEGGFNANGELAYTIIHEFGHVLTLDKTQVNSNISKNDCTHFFTGEGCAKEESFINQLFSRFWKDIWSEFEQAGDNETKREAFYNKYKTRFVTNYAASNPGEDIAEVFAIFVTEKDTPTGNSIVEQKTKLMYDSQELVSLRNYIRGSISSSSKNSGSKNKLSFLPEPGSWKQASTFGKSDKLHCSH
ncbi:MAG: hypothetical protein V3U92_02510 [Cellulophaga sp.]